MGTLNFVLAQASNNGEAVAAGIGLLFIAFIVIFSLTILGLWIWSLIHCATNKQLTSEMRIVGILLIVLLGILGSLIYIFLPREAAQGKDVYVDG